MTVFLTSTTTAEYWFRESTFQLKFQIQEGTERLGGALIDSYHLHGMSSLLRNRKV